jgi:hypothetical protein
MTTTINASTTSGLVQTADTSGSLQLQTANTAALTIDSSQNITTTGNIRLNNSAADGAQVILASSGYSDWNIDNYSGNLRAYYGSSEYFRITSGGDVCINATSTIASAKLYVNGIGAFGNVYVGALGTGTVYSNGGTLTNTNPSDRRLKTNIIPLNYGLADILKLNPVSYNWKDGTNGKQFGFIAQDVQEVMPDAIKNGEYLGLEKDAIYSALVNAIKEQQAQINELKSQLNK